MKTMQDYETKAFADMQARNERFFERHGLLPADVDEARIAYDAFCLDEGKYGKHFYSSPLAFKAFAVGYFKCKTKTPAIPPETKGQ